MSRPLMNIDMEQFEADLLKLPLFAVSGDSLKDNVSQYDDISSVLDLNAPFRSRR